jgi:hypothetical protein
MVWASDAAPTALPETLTRPRTRAPSMVKKRRFSLSIELVYVPSSATAP